MSLQAGIGIKKKKKSKIFRQHTHFQPVLWRRLMSEYSTCVGVPQMLQALKSITQVNVCVGVKAAITEISRCTADTDDVSDFLLSKVKEMSPVCAFFFPHLLSNPWPTNQSQVTATDGLQSAERRRGHRERGFGARLILGSFSTRSVTPLHSKSVYWLVTNVHLIGLREKCEKLHKAGLTGHKSIKSKNLSLFSFFFFLKPSLYQPSFTLVLPKPKKIFCTCSFLQKRTRCRLHSSPNSQVFEKEDDFYSPFVLLSFSHSLWRLRVIFHRYSSRKANQSLSAWSTSPFHITSNTLW